MKIALVQMPPHPRDTPPFEMALTAAILRRLGHEVVVFDVNNDLYHTTFKQRPYWKFQFTDHSVDPAAAIYERESEAFDFHARAILAHGPDVVVFKAENAYHNAVNMGRLLKEKRPGLPVLASGVNTPDKAEIRRWKQEQDGRDEAGRDNLPFDYLIVGEDSEALPAALDAVAGGDASGLRRRFWLNGRVLDAAAGPSVDDMDRRPFYDFGDYDFMRYADPTTIRFSVSNSCTQHCAFCQDWVVGRKFKTMSGDRWFEEYRYQHEKHPSLVHFRHYDRLLNGDMDVLDRFCERVVSGYPEPPVAWGGDFILREEMTDGVIAKMAKARCNSFGTGLESGSERVRSSVHKDFFSNETAAGIFQSCRKHRIPVSLNVIIGLPAETRADFMETIRFVRDNAENLAEVRLTSPALLIQPGTPLANSARRFGIKNAEHEKWETLDGQNDYAERVWRLQEFCSQIGRLPLRLAVNRRTIKNKGMVRRLIEECSEGIDKSRRQVQVESAQGQLAKKIKLLGPWRHELDLGGISTIKRSGRSKPPKDSFTSIWARCGERVTGELKNKTVLDMGCLDGGHSFQAKRSDARFVLGLDEHIEDIRRASFANEHLGSESIQFRRIDALHFDLKNYLVCLKQEIRHEEFQVGLMMDTLCRVPSPFYLLEQLSRVLTERLVLSSYVDLRYKIGGFMWAPQHPSYEKVAGRDPFRRGKLVWLPTAEGLTVLLKSFGFAVVETVDTAPIAKGLGHAIVIASKST